jgi:ubiquinone/menaquinone biosynthesis C-methylase UbiE
MQLIVSKGGSVSPAEFQQTVNVVFHDVEAESYDALHDEMWASLRPVFERIAKTMRNSIQPGKKLVVADIGCGTGLSADMLHAAMGDLIDRFILVDTSSSMMAKCQLRSKHWTVPTEFHCGMIDSIPDSSVDVVLTSSVLHHIPDIAGFCSQLTRVIRGGGLFCHLQDPRNASALDRELEARRTQLQSIREEMRVEGLNRSLLSRLTKSFFVRLSRYRELSYIREVNRRLIRLGVIKKRLTPAEIWSVTDCHIGGLPFSAGDGIDTLHLQQNLPKFMPSQLFSYGFYGELRSHLPPTLQAEEDRLFADVSLQGFYLSGVWKRCD